MRSHRLKTKLVVNAIQRTCGRMNLPFYVLKKGEENAGNIFIKILITETTSKVLSQVNDFNGGTRWEPIGLENSIISNSEAEKYIEKQIHIDPDTWVLEIEDKNEQFNITDLNN